MLLFAARGLSISTDPASMSPIALFLQADIVVKIVMLGLLAASILTWAIIVSSSIKLRRVRREQALFETQFASAQDIDAFAKAHAKADHPSAGAMNAALAEWRRSTKGLVADRVAVRERIAQAIDSGIASEMDRLSDKLNILATVGSIAPFVGLFGTVWGIMRSFTAIAAEKNSSLAVVAPGIAEALFATAIGLFAAIPAVIAYNRLSYALDRLEARSMRFGDSFHALLSHELDRDAG